MCYNSEISLNTFIYGIISAIIVLLLNKIEYWKIIIIMAITSMQLLEYFTWKHIDDKKINYYLSIIGAIIIVIQVSLINYYYLENGIEKIILFMIMFIGIIYIFYYCFKNNLFYMDKGENGHLRWHWVKVPKIMVFTTLFAYLYPLIRSQNYQSALAISILLSFSLYNYYKYETWGSMWCYFSNLAWIYLILRSFYLSQNNLRLP